MFTTPFSACHKFLMIFLIFFFFFHPTKARGVSERPPPPQNLAFAAYTSTRPSAARSQFNFPSYEPSPEKKPHHFKINFSSLFYLFSSFLPGRTQLIPGKGLMKRSEQLSCIRNVVPTADPRGSTSGSEYFWKSALTSCHRDGSLYLGIRTALSSVFFFLFTSLPDG